VYLAITGFTVFTVQLQYMDMLSDISDFLGVLREIPEITTQYSESEDSPNTTRKLLKCAVRSVVQKL